MKQVELYAKVRYAVRIEGLSKRAAARRLGIDPRTVDKMMEFSVPPGYRRSRPPAHGNDRTRGVEDVLLSIFVGSSLIPKFVVKLQITSNRPAAPMPPPTHIVTTTYLTLRRLPSSSAWPTSRAPVMP